MLASVNVIWRISNRSIDASRFSSAIAPSVAPASKSSSREPTSRTPVRSSAAKARSRVDSARETSKVGRASAATP